MSQTEWIISLDDDLKDFDELFVGNVRDGDELIRCKDCMWRDKKTANCERFRKGWYVQALSYCSWAERKEE